MKVQKSEVKRGANETGVIHTKKKKKKKNKITKEQKNRATLGQAECHYEARSSLKLKPITKRSSLANVR